MGGSRREQRDEVEVSQDIEGVGNASVMIRILQSARLVSMTIWHNGLQE